LEFLSLIKDKMKLVELDQKFLSRSVNEGFSGGEKKRNEIFQMAVLQPKLAILDETDSGLDIDALKIVANGVNKLRSKDNATILNTLSTAAKLYCRILFTFFTMEKLLNQVERN
jgi:Fe-S cluster assembly ATP-binding protein